MCVTEVTYVWQNIESKDLFKCVYVLLRYTLLLTPNRMQEKKKKILADQKRKKISLYSLYSKRGKNI